jgi:hypothetical protein
MTINEAVSLALIVGVLSYSLTRFFLYVPELLSVGNENGVRELTAPLYHYLIQSCGDGFFEELLFRVIGVGGLIALFRHAKIMPDIASVIVALLIVSFGFSYIHYLSPVLQESFTPESFIRRSLLGFLLGVVYLWRGFGTAAWTHTFINAFIYASAFYSAS